MPQGWHIQQDPCALTADERAFWALLAQGYTNDAIAQRFISHGRDHKTPHQLDRKGIERWAYQLYQKLGLAKGDNPEHQPRVLAAVLYWARQLPPPPVP